MDQGKRILLVDDEPLVRQTFRLLLELDSHEVIEAEDGAEALESFTEGKFDLVIVDFEMPGMKGNELAVRIKRRAASQPILLVSAYAELLDVADKPVDAVLSKPFTVTDLRGAIGRALTG